MRIEFTPSESAFPIFAGPYIARLAQDSREIRAAQELRYRVFNEELGHGLALAAEVGFDEDIFDAACDHLLLEHVPSGRIVGTYRMQTGHRARAQLGFYSAGEFNLAPLAEVVDQSVELGRACVDRAYRNWGVLSLLWRGISAYAQSQGGRYLFGCSSLNSQTPALGASVYAGLYRKHLVPPMLRVYPNPGFECPLDQLCEETPAVPKLLRSYLSMGAKICGPPALDRRAEDEGESAKANWIHSVAQRLLRVFHVEVCVTGAVPRTGLLVSNHLSYLDIVVLSAVTPAIFVSKHEVASWPVFGWFARAGGTIFVRRDSRANARTVNAQIDELLRRGRLVVLFPEGTSSDGRTVLPFRSSLLQAAVSTESPTSIGCLAYSLPNGNAGEEVCYWKDMTFLPHLLKMLGQAAVFASVRFEAAPRAPDRKALAKQLHSQLSTLHDGKQDCDSAIIPGIRTDTVPAGV